MVVLKGDDTLIAEPSGRVAVSPGCPGMFDNVLPGVSSAIPEAKATACSQAMTSLSAVKFRRPEISPLASI